MSPPEKRRGNNSHPIRSPASSRNSIISLPPRAQLTGGASSSPSPGPENDNTHETTNQVNKDNGGAPLATKEKESTLLKEKNEKITKLKEELDIIEVEFSQELDRLAQKESETASYWQAKYSSLSQELTQVYAELRVLGAEMDAKEAENTKLRERSEVLQNELNERNDEIHSLKRHIAGLKQWVSTSTTRGDQTSDEEFGDSMIKLGNGLQNWVIVHFRRAKLDLTHVDEAILHDLAELVPMYGQLAASAKLHLLQSLVSSILVETIFNAYFVGLTKVRADQLAQVEEYLASLSSVEAVSQWRAMTLTMLRKEATQKMQEETSMSTESVISRVNHILDAITDVSATDARDHALRTLVHSSVELARLLVVQKATFKVHMPKIDAHQKTLFELSTMEDIGAEDEESLAGREICCVTFPGIIKTGDEHGGHPQFMNVVAKARVLCNPE